MGTFRSLWRPTSRIEVHCSLNLLLDAQSTKSAGTLLGLQATHSGYEIRFCLLRSHKTQHPTSCVLMLSRKAAGAFVCLSCRLHRAGASRGGQFLAHLQPSSPSAPAALRRRYGTDATNVQERRGESSGSADWSKPRASETADPETLDPERDPDEARVEDFLKQDPLARRVFQPASDEKSQGGRAVSDEILNQAAQTIISRRGGSIDSRGNAAQESKSFGDPQLDLSATLEREGVDVTLADTLKNIHELQPLRSRVLSDVDYQALQLVLVRGFTLEQLRRYIHYSRAARDFEKGNLPPWILQRPLWKAMLSDAPAATQNGLDTTKKGKLADRLMGECWGLTTETSHDREGQLDIRLRDVEFTLLSRMFSHAIFLLVYFKPSYCTVANQAFLLSGQQAIPQ